MAPIGGDDGVAVAGLGECEGRDWAWCEKVEEMGESGCSDKHGGGTGIGEKVVGGDRDGGKCPVICMPCWSYAVVDVRMVARTSSRWGSG